MTYKVVIPQDVSEVGKAFLRGKGYEVVIGSGKTDFDTLKAEIADADALLLRTASYPEEVLRAAKKLRVIGRHGVGVDNIAMDYCNGNNIVVTYTPQANANSVAEHTLGFLFALSANLARMDKATKEGQWELRNKLVGSELVGKTLGLVGLGRIGSMVAKKANLGLEMKVVVFDPYVEREQYPEFVTPVATAEEVFRQGDFVSLHVPSTPETRQMVNRAMLELMKPGAYLINCGRGDLVAEDDLHDAIHRGVIRGAALDVFSQEPPAKDNPLLALDNVIVSPHNAALTQESMDRMGLHAAMGIDAVLSGNKPEWPANHLK